MILSDFQDCATCPPAFAGLGAPSPGDTTVLKRCKPKGSWEAWCRCVFAGDAANLAKCQAKGLNVVAYASPPWDMAGARARNIPYYGKGGTDQVLGLIGGYILDQFNLFGIKTETPPPPQGMTQAQANAMATQQGPLGKWTLPVGLGIGAVILLGLVYAGTR